jgi:hypothetical protein
MAMLPMVHFKLLLQNFLMGSIGQNSQYLRYDSEMLHPVRSLTDSQFHKIWLINIANYTKIIEGQSIHSDM